MGLLEEGFGLAEVPLRPFPFDLGLGQLGDGPLDAIVRLHGLPVLLDDLGRFDVVPPLLVGVVGHGREDLEALDAGGSLPLVLNLGPLLVALSPSLWLGLSQVDPVALLQFDVFDHIVDELRMPRLTAGSGRRGRVPRAPVLVALPRIGAHPGRPLSLRSPLRPGHGGRRRTWGLKRR